MRPCQTSIFSHSTFVPYRTFSKPPTPAASPKDLNLTPKTLIIHLSTFRFIHTTNLLLHPPHPHPPALPLPSPSSLFAIPGHPNLPAFLQSRTALLLVLDWQLERVEVSFDSVGEGVGAGAVELGGSDGCKDGEDLFRVF